MFSFLERIPLVTKNLLLLNIVFYIVTLIFGSRGIQLIPILGAHYVNSPLFEPYQIVTHFFMHDDQSFMHIFFNMFGLVMFGSLLEKIWGPKRFFIFYFACGLAAAVTHLVLQNAPAVGASGAIMGLFAAFAYLFPNTQLVIFPIPVPVKAKYAVAIMAAFDLFGGVYSAGSNIAHFAHLGGLVMGFILVLIWNKTNKKTFY